jgi:hypothetical protein
MIDFQKSFFFVVVSALVLIVLYLSFETGFFNGFTFDDHLAIDGNHDVIGSKYDTYLWFHDIWGKDLLEEDSHKSYRPLLIVIFHYLWKYEANAYVFRAFCLLFHFLACMALYCLVVSFFKEKNTSVPLNRSVIIIGIASVLLFASHPIHVESVTAVVNLAEPACAFFVILSYLLYKNIYYTLNSPLLEYNSEKKSVNSRSFSASLLTVFFKLLVWMMLVVIAILLKETGIVTLLLSFAYVVLAFGYQFLVDTVLLRNLSSPSSHEHSDLLVSLSNHRRKKLTVAAILLFFPLFMVYCYFVFREIITSSNRLVLLTNPKEFLSFFLLFFFRKKGVTSYLNSSGLIRRAENPFVFLKGLERVLSYLVGGLFVPLFFSSIFPSLVSVL